MRYLELCLFLLILGNVRTQASNENIECPFGYFDYNAQNKTICIECLSSCSICDNFDDCKDCSEGYSLNQDNNKCDSCQKGFLECDQEFSCQPHYQLDNITCQPVCKVQNCQDCNSIFQQTCNICADNFSLNEDFKKCGINSNNLQEEEKTIDVIEQRTINGTKQKQQIQIKNNTNKDLASNPRLLQQNMMDCEIGSYFDKNKSSCEKCDMKCGTCYNFADQCLECSQNYTKIGWKCVKQQNLKFMLVLDLNNQDLTENINEFKDALRENALPQKYQEASNSVFTLQTIINNEKEKTATLEGKIDQFGEETLEQIKKTLLENLKKNPQLGQFTVTSYSVLTGNQVIHNDDNSNNDDDDVIVEEGFEWWWILVIAVGGAIVLFILIIACCCCMKKKDDSDVHKNESIPKPSTQRQLNE